MTDDHSGSGMPGPDQLKASRVRADARDRDAAGRLAEVLAGQGDQQGALAVWARTYGDCSPTTKRLAELLAERGDVAGAVSAWRFSDAMRQNPEGSHASWLKTLPDEDRLECEDDPEDWAFMEAEQVARLLADRGDATALAELRARACAGDSAAASTWLTITPRDTH
ncbi:hypothetical protein BS329_01760 [Amycolatopsis coloradensis]|uniref:Uncharacterized protein n=1 Tax=Amycolatopsis coloradensis TaxID=76021 RepID=A0A1R0L3V0_9PSEU|nr:hypothetical protein [Amycolatopsis coloradensis]OLZ57420.1 hypothetical protein BS329_01760 [Amycolatopsis coloradensis]